jgi:hypothetical protein
MKISVWRTADFAIFVMMLFGSSKFSIPSETRSCCAWAEMGPVVDSLRGMALGVEQRWWLETTVLDWDKIGIFLV